MTRPDRARPHASGRAAQGAEADAGQASVELLALVPLLLVATLAVAAGLTGYRAREAADQAAVAAAVAQLQGGDPQGAARAAAPGWSRARIRVGRGRATVRIEPRLPRSLAAAIDAEQTVIFGAEARP